jgi:hypothetical protein
LRARSTASQSSRGPRACRSSRTRYARWAALPALPAPPARRACCAAAPHRPRCRAAPCCAQCQALPLAPPAPLCVGTPCRRRPVGAASSQPLARARPLPPLPSLPRPHPPRPSPPARSSSSCQRTWTSPSPLAARSPCRARTSSWRGQAPLTRRCTAHRWVPPPPPTTAGRHHCKAAAAALRRLLPGHWAPSTPTTPITRRMWTPARRMHPPPPSPLTHTHPRTPEPKA